MLMPEKKNLVVFDIDGTLTDTVALHQLAFTAAVREMGVVEIDTNFKAYTHHTDSFIAGVNYERSGTGAFTPDKVSELERLLLQQIHGKPIPEISGACKMLAFIEQETDYGICFATGSLWLPASYKLSALGITFAPEQLVASNKIVDREGIVNSAISAASGYYNRQHFDHILSVGDGLWDLITAQNLGLDFIGIGPLHKDLLAAHGAKMHLDDWTDFDMVRVMDIFRDTPETAGIRSW